MKNKTKRVRTTFTEEQIQILQANFQLDSNPDGQDLERIAQITNLSKRVTQVGQFVSRLDKKSKREIILVCYWAREKSGFVQMNSFPQNVSQAKTSSLFTFFRQKSLCYFSSVRFGFKIRERDRRSINRVNPTRGHNGVQLRAAQGVPCPPRTRQRTVITTSGE